MSREEEETNPLLSGEFDMGLDIRTLDHDPNGRQIFTPWATQVPLGWATYIGSIWTEIRKELSHLPVLNTQIDNGFLQIKYIS